MNIAVFRSSVNDEFLFAVGRLSVKRGPPIGRSCLGFAGQVAVAKTGRGDVPWLWEMILHCVENDRYKAWMTERGN